MKLFKFFIIITYLLSSNFLYAKELHISNDFLISDSLDFGILNPFDRCNNAVIVSNSLNCTNIDNDKAIRIELPMTFETIKGQNLDVQITYNTTPGQEFPMEIIRAGVPITNGSVEYFPKNSTEIIIFQLDFYLFGPNAKSFYSGDISFDVIIN